MQQLRSFSATVHSFAFVSWSLRQSHTESYSNKPFHSSGCACALGRVNSGQLLPRCGRASYFYSNQSRRLKTHQSQRRVFRPTYVHISLVIELASKWSCLG